MVDATSTEGFSTGLLAHVANFVVVVIRNKIRRCRGTLLNIGQHQQDACRHVGDVAVGGNLRVRGSTETWSTAHGAVAGVT